jgi:hypothetical protein
MSSSTGTAGVPSVTFTDEHALAATGLEPRRFRELVKARGIPFARVGRRMVVRVDDWLRAVDALSGAAPRPAPAWDEQATIEAAAGA